MHHSTEIAPARGRAEKGKITLLPAMTAAETFATLVHGISPCGHSTSEIVETTRISASARPKPNPWHMLSATLSGLRGYHRATLSRPLWWKLLLESLEHVQEAASRILDAIEVTLEKTGRLGHFRAAPRLHRQGAFVFLGHFQIPHWPFIDAGYYAERAKYWTRNLVTNTLPPAQEVSNSAVGGIDDETSF